MKKPFFVSTAIDYPSEKPHLGHALEKIQADVLARYRKLQGFDVHFSTGTDEHGLKIQRQAQKAKREPQEFVDEMSAHFKDLWDKLNISYDDFVRTSEQRHSKVSQKIFQTIYDKGDIYQGKYQGLYCVECESYYLPKDLENNCCPVHKKPVETVAEETYFFRMSKYQQKLLEHIEKHQTFIVPTKRKNEILKRLQEPLQDLSISRKAVTWGIPLPWDKSQSSYVWIEALMGYLTTIDYPNTPFNKFWPADIHVIGKDIIWHHSVIWGSWLLSLGIPLPKTILVHGFISVGGQKMSKSLGNVVDPFALVEKYGADAVRYYLLREIPTTEDGDFTYEKFEERYNAELASGIGNLVSRVVTMAGDGVHSSKEVLLAAEIKREIEKEKKRYKRAIDEFKLHEALKAVWDFISFCDAFIEKKRPWEKKEDTQKTLYSLLYALAHISHEIRPFLPDTAEKIAKQLGIDLTDREPWTFTVKKDKSLFPRIGSKN